MDYGNSKIYQVLNNFDDDVYVGSTCQPLCKRLAFHRVHMNVESKSKRKLYTKMTELGIEQFYIELIEQYPCENKEELRKREGHFIRERGTLNMCQAGRNRRQHYQDNIEHFRQKDKEWREKHQEQLKEKAQKPEVKLIRNAKVSCECGGSYTYTHKAEHFKCKKHLEYVKSLKEFD